jgi:thioredoxin-like negative regulator of GroEL
VSTTNFNYQVALKEGLRSLQQGRLRQAEQSFKYLVSKFPGAEGGYRGLAKVYFEQDDRSNAMRVLRDGAAALSKSGERSSAINLLREAAVLDPHDLGVHRRLAAALALTGDGDAAVKEYARYIRDLRTGGEVDRAKAEATYAVEQLKDNPASASLTLIAIGEEPPAPRPEPAPKASVRATSGGTTALRPKPVDPWDTERRPEVQAVPSASRTPPAAPAPQPSAPAFDPWASHAPETVPAPEPTASGEPEPAAEAETPPEPEEPAVTLDADSPTVEAAAARYLATRDPRAAPLALEAARRYIDEGHTDAASDLLLQLIAAGVADHGAQRLLVDVARTLGKREVAKVKCHLLAQALLLDGQNDLAAEVEALARAE